MPVLMLMVLHGMLGSWLRTVLSTSVLYPDVVLLA